MTDHNKPDLNRTSFKNFYCSTRAEFSPVRCPDDEPGFVSRSGSAYWDVEEGVIRSSDHWAGVGECTRQASCVWTLRDAIRDGVWAAGFCAYENFRKRSWGPREHAVTSADRIVAERIRQGGGAAPHPDFVPPPVWAHLSLPGSVFADEPALALFAREPLLRRAVSAPEDIVSEIISGADMIRFGRVMT